MSKRKKETSTSGANRPAESTGGRDLKIIEAEILKCKNHIEESYLLMGKLLNEAKAKIGYGYWVAWLHDNVEISAVTARRYMRIAEEFEKGPPVTDFRYSKASILMTLPIGDRDDFIKNPHEVNGIQKSVAGMSKRELENAVRDHMQSKSTAKPHYAPVTKESAPIPEETESNPAETFKSNLDLVQRCIDQMFNCLEELENHPKTCSDLSSALLGICESTMQNLQLSDIEVNQA